MTRVTIYRYCTRCATPTPNHSAACIAIGVWTDFFDLLQPAPKQRCLECVQCVGHAQHCSHFGEIHGSEMYPEGSKPYVKPLRTMEELEKTGLTIRAADDQQRSITMAFAIPPSLLRQGRQQTVLSECTPATCPMLVKGGIDHAPGCTWHKDA